MRNDFFFFLISHGRAYNIITVETLQRCGYTGKWYIIIDDEDDQESLYVQFFGKEHIIKFNKQEVGNTFDIMDNFPGRQVPTFARNALHEIAHNLGLTYFLELEDDYQNFRQRYLDDTGKFCTRYVRDLDSIIDACIEFLEVSGATTVAFAQTGDLIGGPDSKVFTDKISRKAMNCFFCKTDRPFQCFGRFNDDVNAYIDNGKRGMLFFTICDIVMDQPQTQTRSGGITDSYKYFGTYVKTFYSVMLAPNCIKVSTLGISDKRIHHVIDWEHAVPKIISGDFKK